ncbi:hypothetical protein EVAR_12682_1 [Eumeta japonica]|uniref:Uncharacterized protein n=1 Tax=Eumeta variegata TaxID=151549 RepID=A0A4C1UMH7_EUMVA|nr:hypothetical protein EVAR_12682_1 [Eumeta japonica]
MARSNIFHKGAPIVVFEFTLRWRARAHDLVSHVGYALVRHKATFLALSSMRKSFGCFWRLSAAENFLELFATAAQCGCYYFCQEAAHRREAPPQENGAMIRIETLNRFDVSHIKLDPPYEGDIKYIRPSSYVFRKIESTGTFITEQNIREKSFQVRSACEPLESTWSSPLTPDTCNSRRVHLYVAALLVRNRISDRKRMG